jgi:hypothetical protein
LEAIVKYLFLAGIGCMAVLMGCDKPVQISYGQKTASYCTGAAISSNKPTIVGEAKSFSVSPALPAGLSLSMVDGSISGTPTAISPAAAYIVTAMGSGSMSGADTLSITVGGVGVPTYASPIALTEGVAAASAPVLSGGAITECSAQPALPAGLSIDKATCAITGTPAKAAKAADYQVTTMNACGNNTVAVNITVSPAVKVAKKAIKKSSMTHVNTPKMRAPHAPKHR